MAKAFQTVKTPTRLSRAATIRRMPRLPPSPPATGRCFSSSCCWQQSEQFCLSCYTADSHATQAYRWLAAACEISSLSFLRSDRLGRIGQGIAQTRIYQRSRQALIAGRLVLHHRAQSNGMEARCEVVGSHPERVREADGKMLAPEGQ